MITLTILNADGTAYWTEAFNDIASAQAWLGEEQTRPYWDASFTSTIVDNTPPPPTAAQLTAQAWTALRMKRDSLLSACDWTQLGDTPLESAVKIAWETYRQALRDLPAKTTDPTNPTWPTPPGST